MPDQPVQTPIAFERSSFGKAEVITARLTGIIIEAPIPLKTCLSKELKSLQANKLIQKEVYDTFPPTVEYTMAPHGMSLKKVLYELWTWALSHRKEVIGI